VIPRIIHQTWKDHDLPERFRESAESWRRHHPDWEWRLWTDADIQGFVDREFPEMAPLFASYPDQIQRVDAVRYLILSKIGGFYADLDVICLKPFDTFRDQRVLLPPTKPAGFSNDLMASEADSPFFAHVAASLEEAKRRWDRFFIPRHLRVLLTTGPLFVTRCYHTFPGKGSITILPKDVYGTAPGEDVRIRHIVGDSWAGWDTHLFNFIYRNWTWLLAAAIGLALTVTVTLLMAGRS
jgi:mannosyltransferase OCH1-like enzyme